MKYLASLFILLLFLVSCKKNQELQQMEFAPENFHSLEFNSYFKVFLIQGDENKFRVEGTAKRIKDLVWEVDNGVLRFKSKGKFSWTKPGKSDLKLYITVKELKLIKANQTCEIESLNTLSGDELGIVFADKLNLAKLDVMYNTVFYWNNFPCGGKLELSGSCTHLKIWNFALMQIDALDLDAENALVENSSKGDCKVWVEKEMEYGIFGEGNIYLKGSPALVPKDVTEEGKGELIML